MSGLLLVFIASFLIISDGKLNVKDAQLLVENTPDFLNASRAKRCPRVELLWSAESDIAFQVRSHCTKSPSGLIGNYVVDKQTAEVWIGVDRDELIQSKHLKQLQQEIRRKILGRKGQLR